MAQLFGESEHTTRKRLAIVEAAKAEPEQFSKLVADMDKTGRIAGVYRRLSIIQQGERMRAAPPPLPTGPFCVGVPIRPGRSRFACSTLRGAPCVPIQP